jgi:GT2 family glycosyltransferase
MPEDWVTTIPDVVNSYDENMISIIIPVFNYNNPLFHYTGNCIGSVREHTDLPYEIILVENGSPVKHKELKDYKAEKVIINEKNMGVAHAWNQGIRMSRGGYICLLNNDTMVFDHWDTDMVEHLKSGDLDLVMSTPMYGDAFARAVEAKERREAALAGDKSKILSDFRDFACVMCKKSLFEELGTFDERFTLAYGEDLDFLKRMDEAGKKYASSKLINIFHIINATTTGMKEIPELMNVNKKILEEKWDLIKENKNEVWGEEIKNPLKEEIDIAKKSSSVFRASMTGDRVYLVRGNDAHWITNPEVLAKLGCGFDDIKTMSDEDFSKLMYGEFITLENVSAYVSS